MCSAIYPCSLFYIQWFVPLNATSPYCLSPPLPLTTDKHQFVLFFCEPVSFCYILQFAPFFRFHIQVIPCGRCLSLFDLFHLIPSRNNFLQIHSCCRWNQFILGDAVFKEVIEFSIEWGHQVGALIQQDGCPYENRKRHGGCVYRGINM